MSAWGKAWGNAWGDAWGAIAVAIAPLPPAGGVNFRPMPPVDWSLILTPIEDEEALIMARAI